MIVNTVYSVPLFFMGFTFWKPASKAGTVNTAATSKHVEYHCLPMMSYFSVSFRDFYIFSINFFFDVAEVHQGAMWNLW